MGIDISGGMILGASYDDLVPFIEDIAKTNGDEDFDIDEFDITEWLDDNELDYMSPWFDSDPCDWTIGVCVPTLIMNGPDKIKWNKDLKLAYDKMVDLFGEHIELKLIGMQHVY